MLFSLSQVLSAKDNIDGAIYLTVKGWLSNKRRNLRDNRLK
jgi:hypothetical protein